MSRILLPPLFRDGVYPSFAESGNVDRTNDGDQEQLRAQLLDAEHTSEIFSASSTTVADAVGMMPTPDEVAHRFQHGQSYKIYDDMQRQVLFYGALIEGRISLLMSLPMTWLPGKKGDAAAELARDQVQSAWENIDDREIARYALSRQMIETGFSGGELVWDVHTRGAARDLIAPIAIIDRPKNWFWFDWLNRPFFRPEFYSGQGGPISDYKVMWGRFGSMHTRYGAGVGQKCYPAVYAINTLNRLGLEALERSGYAPAVIVYPKDWNREKKNDLEYSVWRTWKNFISIPGDVVKPEITFPSKDQTTAGTNAEGHLNMVSKFEYWLSMYVWGSMLTSGNISQGSYARDEVHDTIRLERTASQDAPAEEAMINRGFVRPIMLANNGSLDESLWPRAAIDAKPGADVKLLLEIADAADKIGFPVSRAWFKDTFNIPPALTVDDKLTAPQPAQPFGQGGNPFAQAQQQGNVVDAAKRLMTEQAVICVSDEEGRVLRFASHEAVLTENRGAVRAAELQSGDTLVVTRRMLRARAA